MSTGEERARRVGRGLFKALMLTGFYKLGEWAGRALLGPQAALLAGLALVWFGLYVHPYRRVIYHTGEAAGKAFAHTLSLCGVYFAGQWISRLAFGEPWAWLGAWVLVWISLAVYPGE